MVRPVLSPAERDLKRLLTGRTSVSVTEFGAKGDGSTEDTAAFQAALDAAAASGGGVVNVPPGTFLVDALSLASNVALVGAGRGVTVLQKSGSGTAVVLSEDYATLAGTAGGNGPHSFALRDLTIDGDKAGSGSGMGVAVWGYGYEFSRIGVKNCSSWGVYSQWAFTTPPVGSLAPHNMAASWDDLRVHANSGGGVYFDGPNESFFDSIEIFRNNGIGFHIDTKGNAAYIGSVHVWGNEHTYLMKVEATGVSVAKLVLAGATSSPRVGLEVLGTNFRCPDAYIFRESASAGTGIKLGSAAGSAAASCFIRARVSNWTTYGVHLDNLSGANTIDVDVYGTSGVAVQGTPNSSTWFRCRADGGITGGQGLYTNVPIGVFGSTPASRQTVSGTATRDVVDSLLSALDTYGLVADSSTADTGAWTAWSPTFSGITAGNGTVSARYRVDGRTLHWHYQIVLGSTSAVGTNPKLSTPSGWKVYNAGNTVQTYALGKAFAYDSSAGAFFEGGCYGSDSTDDVLTTRIIFGSTTVNAAAPFTWASGDILVVSGTCEVEPS